MRNVLEWLEHNAEQYPTAPAFTDPQGSITWRKVKEGARKCGTWLASVSEVRRPIGFYLEKSTAAVTGMLGAVYAGDCYTFLDLRQPDARLLKIVEILNPAAILTDEEHLKEAEEKFRGIPVASIESILASGSIDADRLQEIRLQACDTDPLYINFTSGSTGVPKGVVVSHRSVIDFIPVFDEQFHITKEDVIGNQAPFDFDVSVKDLFSGLYTGARTAIIPRQYFSAPMKLMDYLLEQKCTTLIWAVSAMCFVSIMNGFGYKVPTDVNKVIFSGEVMPIKQLNVWKKYLPDAIYVNVYGPTEITCNCTCHLLNRDYDLKESIPIGKPFPNEKVFLLDEEDHLITQPEKTGEICVAGTCLALGYYRNPEKTNQVFVQNPLNSDYPERIYRTGDLGYYNADKDLVYVSRKDFQIKHLGHRIELGEIETAVQALDQVTRACCLYNNAKKRIVLFYTGSKDKKELLSELRGVLPGYMLPNTLIQLEEMPLSKNGKIDRNELKQKGGIA